jgi:uncharacterized protein YukE
MIDRPWSGKIRIRIQKARPETYALEMDFEEDFIDDSCSISDKQDPENELFLTTTLSRAPALDEMPASDVRPITEITRSLISATSSLLLFGSSSVGTTVTGTIYGLSENSARIREKFPLFVQDIRKRMDTKEYRVQRVYAELKRRIDKMTKVNRRLKAAVRTGQRLLLRNTTDAPDLAGLHAEVKAAAGTLRQAIQRIQSSRAAVHAI